ncbi:ROK family transcriptional regulator [Streptomyces venezuelae]|uniref:ROK family transcriptional regulator n=1 Tax=Streptomyces venezuelae TaxID=54571 RepID=UPI001CC260F3|nr:ROK family transcriptional regulator [Streptomyces venezuelae]
MKRANGTAGVNLPGLRGHNAALVLDLLRGAGAEGLGRGELAERTGLTPQAVSKITARLRAEGLVAEAGRGASTGGKPRTLLRLVPGAGHAVGVHLDRDEVRVVRVDLAGRVVAESRAGLNFAAGPAGPAAVVDVVEELVRAVRTAADGSFTAVLGVGVAAPGPLDRSAGVLGRVTGFPDWAGYPLRDVLEERLGVRVELDKDTHAGAAAAAWSGPGAGAYLHLGTGLGAGLCLDGRVYRGGREGRSGAGEFGHQVLQLDGPPCRCGARGCVEALCLAAVARGDLAEAARILGEAAANLVALLDVERVLLGGRVVTESPEVFLAGVAEVLRARARAQAGVLGPAGVPGSAGVEVSLAGGGVAEGAADLILGPLFGRS